MNWYIATIVFRITGKDVHQPVPSARQLCLITASDSEEAQQKANMIGNTKQDCFLDLKKQWVQWQFSHVAELTLLGALTAPLHWPGQLTKSLMATDQYYPRSFIIAGQSTSCISLHRIFLKIIHFCSGIYRLGSRILHRSIIRYLN